MGKLIQYCTKASRYNGEFGGSAGWPAAGMGYVFVSENRHLIVVDGGHGEDAEELVQLLTDCANDDIPPIDLWIVTHPHLDHYGALCEIAARDDLRKRVRVKQLVYCFPASFRDRNGKAPCDKANRYMEEICTALGAEAHVPTERERMNLNGLELTILFVPPDCGGLTDCTALHNPNSLSLIFTVQRDGRRVMMTGDACPVTMQYCVEKYGSALKSDILQLPHHGLCDTGNPDFYRLVNAEILLIPISEAGDRAMKSGAYGDATAANHVAEALAEAIHRAFEETVTIEL